MLAPETVKPFLMHENSDVRMAATTFLRGFNDPAIASADDLWPVIDRYGAGAHGLMLYNLSLFPQTDASLKRVLNDPSVRDDLGTIDRVVDYLDLEMLRGHREMILAADIDPITQENLQERLRLAELTAETIWAEITPLVALSEANGWSEEVEEKQNRLIEAAARFPADLAERAMRMFHESELGTTAWEIAAGIVGKLKLPTAIDALLEARANEDDDLVSESAFFALDEYRNEELIQRIDLRLENSSTHFRNPAAELLGHLRIAPAEQLLSRMLERETDRDTRSFIASALMGMGTDDPKTWERLRDIAERLDYDEDFFDLRPELATFAVISGMDLPQAEQWRRDEAQRHAERKRRRQARSEDMEYEAEETDDEPEMRDWEELSAPEGMIVRSTPKVGRNDPCPCGSGKKYKKCCLGKE